MPTGTADGSHAIQVGKKGSSFPSSAPLSITVSATVTVPPTITSINPSTAATGDVVYVYGTGFTQDSVVIIDGNSANSRTISPSKSSTTCNQAASSNACISLYFSVPEFLSAGGHAIQVANGSDGARSNGVGLTVANPTTTIQAKGVKITSAIENAIWTAGDSKTFTWTSVGLEGATGYIELSTSGARYRIADNIPNSGSYTWANVGTMPGGALMPYGGYSVKIIMNGYGDISGPLTISNKPMSFMLTAPSRGVTWTIGDTQEIRWSATGIRPAATGYIELVGGGVTYQIGVISYLGNSSNFSYSVGSTVGGGSVPAGIYRLQMFAVDGNDRLAGLVDSITIAPRTQAAPVIQTATAMIYANSAFANPTYVLGDSSRKIGSFQVSASNSQSVSISSITIGKSGNNSLSLQNMRLVANGAQFGQTQAIVSVSQTFSTNFTVIIPAGGSVVFDVYADISSSSSAGMYSGVVSLTNWIANGVTSGSAVSFPGIVNGQAITVTSGSTSSGSTSSTRAAPTVSMNRAFDGPAYHPGDTNKKVASFEFRAPDNEAMTYGTFGFKNNSSVFALQNLKVMIGGTQIGQTQSVVTRGQLMNFQSYYAVTVPAGSAIYVDVYADILSTVPPDIYSGAISLSFLSTSYVSSAGQYLLPQPVSGQMIRVVE